MTETLKQQSQTVIVRDDGVVVYIVHGPPNADEARKSMRFIRQHTAQYPYTVTIVEFRTSDAPDAETRKAIAEEVDKKPSATVFVGGSFAMRTIAKMMTKVINMMKTRPDPIAFVDTMAEAEVWVAKTQVEMAAQLTAAGGGAHVR
jgi:hypothetical protein